MSGNTENNCQRSAVFEYTSIGISSIGGVSWQYFTHVGVLAYSDVSHV